MTGLRLAVAAVASCLAGAGLLAACGEESDLVPGASAERGRELIVENGCGTCHRIGGIERANGDVGPPLMRFRENRLIAGRLPNNPENVVRWLLDPQAIRPNTVMPNLRLTPQQARDIASYLYSQ